MARILVVDDRPINREYLTTVLSYFNHQTTEASDGVEALKLAHADPPDLVITDILMPNMDGEEFVRLLQADPNLAHIPVIFYTATYMTSEAAAIGKECAAFAVLIKPAEPETVARTVQAALGLPLPESVPAVDEDLVRQQVPEVVEELRHDVSGLEQSSYRLAAMLEASLRMASERDPDRVLEAFCRSARSILVAKYAAVGVFSEKQGELEHFSSAGGFAGQTGEVHPLSTWSAALGRLPAGRHPIRLGGREAEQAALGRLPGTPIQSSVTAILAVPLFPSERFYGWLVLVNRLGGGEFTVEDERIGAALATRAALAYQNVQRALEMQLQAVTLEREMREHERIEMEKEENRKQQIRIKDEFLSHVSHELRSPLAALHQFTTILLDGLAGEVNPEQRQYLEIMLRNCRQLSAMIDDLLAVTRAEVGKVPVRLECASLEAVVRETTEALRAKVAEKNVKLSTDLTVGLPQVWADPARTRQVLTNLIENASKFTPPAGSIRVRARVFDQDSNFVVASVADTGCGIKHENLRAIFDRLFQESSTDESRKGLGLGLYIARDLVTRQGGRIWVESELGKGSTFFFTLPVFSLARLLEPYLSPETLDRGFLSLITIALSPASGNGTTTAEKQALRLAREVAERCVRPDSDLVLPGLGPAGSGRHLYVLARADAAGVEGLADRIRTQLKASRDLQEIGLAEPTVSFTMLPAASLGPDGPWAARLGNLANQIEEMIGEEVGKECHS